MKILVIGPSWVGDMVMSQSLYKTLKQQYPSAQIDVLAPGWCKPILERMEEVTQAIEMPLKHKQFGLVERYRIGKKLADERYDKAYVLPRSAKSALIPFFARVPTRIGWKGEMRFGLLNDIRPNRKSFQYMVERFVALAHPKKKMVDSSSLGGIDSMPKPELKIDTQQQANSIAKFSLSNNKNKTIGICPGAEFGPAKQWPAEKYAEVVQYAVDEGYQVLLFGSPKDQAICSSIKQKIDNKHHNVIFNLAGETSLTEAVDLLGLCKTVVSNDSGLMHVAAAVGCHVIGIYGSTSPEYTPPLCEKLDIIHTDIACRPCFKRECPLGHLKCLKELDAHKVISKIHQ